VKNVLLLSLALTAFATSHAQAPSGSVAGRITDPTGAAISEARVVVTSRETGLRRAFVTSAEGEYSAPAPPAGTYEVAAEADGFKRLVREAVVEAGTATTADLSMQVGATSTTVKVEGAAPQIQYDTHQISGVVTRPQIEGLPLNGRSFLELARSSSPDRG
jgi:hypothetical protein